VLLVKKLLLCALSFSVFLVMLEWYARVTLGLPTFKSMADGTVLLDGVSVLNDGSTLMPPENSSLPYGKRSNYDHVITPVFNWHPKSWKLTTDEWGFRNPQFLKAPDILMVGDSVTFGPGVENHETFTSILSKTLEVPIYNLSIGGAGFGMYMAMINDYLERVPWLKQIIVVTYAGNDHTDTHHAYWPELEDCKPPKAKIFRSDLGGLTGYPAPVLMTSFLRNSSLVAFFHLSTQERKHIFQQIHTLEVLGNRVIGTLKRKRALELGDVKKNAAYILITQLLERPSVPPSIKEALDQLRELIKADNIAEVPQACHRIVVDLINADCYPILNFRNLTTHLSMEVGRYFYDLSKSERDLPVLTKQYSSVLRSLRGYPEVRAIDEVNSMLELLKSDEIVDVERFESANVRIHRILREMIGSQKKTRYGHCPKVRIFVLFLKKLAQAKGIDVSIYVLPGERLSKPHESKYLENIAEGLGIECNDLTSRFKEYYNKPNPLDPTSSGNSLHLDPHHLNALGHRMVAEWIADHYQRSRGNGGSKVDHTKL